MWKNFIDVFFFFIIIIIFFFEWKNEIWKEDNIFPNISSCCSVIGRKKELLIVFFEKQNELSSL